MSSPYELHRCIKTDPQNLTALGVTSQETLNRYERATVRLRRAHAEEFVQLCREEGIEVRGDG
jgi:hypothetical protein